MRRGLTNGPRPSRRYGRTSACRVARGLISNAWAAGAGLCAVFLAIRPHRPASGPNPNWLGFGPLGTAGVGQPDDQTAGGSIDHPHSHRVTSVSNDEGAALVTPGGRLPDEAVVRPRHQQHRLAAWRQLDPLARSARGECRCLRDKRPRPRPCPARTHAPRSPRTFQTRRLAWSPSAPTREARYGSCRASSACEAPAVSST